jgi:hypothetical protein
MLNFLEWLASGFWDIVRRLAGLVVPFLSRKSDFRGIAPRLLRIVGILLLAAIIVGLWWVNKYVIPKGWILPPSLSFHDFYLPILGLLLYVLVWLAWWLWTLLGPEAVSSDFPDIDQAWETALRALNQAGIDLREAPLFLILGRPQGSEAALFEGAQLQLKIANLPKDDRAPLHVFANRDGIYVTCAGASLLGRQAAILAGEGDSSLDGFADGAAAGVAAGPGDDLFKTLQPKGRLKEVQTVLQRAREQGRKPDQLSEAEKEEIRLLIAQEEQEHAQKSVKPRPLLLKHTEEVTRLKARLQHLCRLLARDRHPYCPINGLMVLISFAATDRNEDADQTGALLQQDLTIIRETLQVHCPVITLVCDLETVPGFREFIDRFPSEQRQRRVGQRFPLAPDLAEGESLTEWINRSVQWICSGLFPTWIYKLFRVETPGREESLSAVRGNTRLYQLLCEVRDRRQRLSSIFTRGLAAEDSQPWMFGGCYLASTSRNVLQEQAFVPGVFRRLTENQNFVSWTEKALKQEESQNRLANYLRIGLVGGVVLLFTAIIIAYKLLK